MDSTIFRAADRYDATPVIEKDDSSTDVSYTDGSSTLEVTVDIVGSDTDSLDIDPTILFNYQLIIQLTDGREFTVAEGNLEVRKKIPTGG